MSVTIRAADRGDVSAITEITNALIGSTSYEWREEPYSLENRADGRGSLTSVSVRPRAAPGRTAPGARARGRAR